MDELGRPFVLKERLRQRRKGQSHGHPFSFLHLNRGSGLAWKGEEGRQIDEENEYAEIQDLLRYIQSNTKEESNRTEIIELDDNRKLGIAILGTLKQYPRIAAFRRFIEDWYLSYLAPDVARDLPLAGPQSRLNVRRDNLGNVVQYMEHEHPRRFRNILEKITEKIPGIENIDTERTNDGRLLLRFNDKRFEDPFFAQQMSDGTLKYFAYLLLLEGPTPPPFLCIEEPENGLYHKLLEGLAYEFRSHTTGKATDSQVFITTHQPYFINALEPEEVWILEKGYDGYAKIRRASDIDLVKNLVAEGLPLGGLWYSDYLDDR